MPLDLKINVRNITVYLTLDQTVSVGVGVQLLSATTEHCLNG
jgi:hypothetical protein